MAVLKNVRTGEVVALRAPHRFGRSRTNHTVLPSAEVSSEHALITYADTWQVRDLGSRNGTQLDGTALEPGARVSLTVGARLIFGGTDDAWEIVSTGPPAPSATCGDEVVEGDPDLLALPSPDDPQLLVLRDGETGWQCDDAPVHDGAEITVQGTNWVLQLPEQLAPTEALSSNGPGLDEVALSFRVSRDEEYVELTVHLTGTAHPLPARTHHYLLLTLARARLEDVAEGLGDAEAGWRRADDVERMLRATKNQVHVGIHRLRKELAGLGVSEAQAIVERRVVTQQLRIGVLALEVHPL
ncbi:MAG: FHA domain-containing protein [Myxococcales bacterium]|nr:FHA domain-containing protein [Myxococcales bacterium]